MKSLTRHLLRLLPLMLIIVAFILAFHFKLNTYLSLEAIKAHKDILNSWINTHYLYSVLLYMLIYTVAVGLSLPGAVFITLAGGFMFGGILGSIYVVISATLGATCIFMIVQYSLGEWLAEKSGSWVARMQKGFQENAFQYLLFLRLVPLFPFQIVNIVPGILNIDKSTYIIATFFGIIPGSFVYANLGNGLSHIFASGEALNMSIIFEPQVLWPLIGLASLSLIPIAYKKLKGKGCG